MFQIVEKQILKSVLCLLESVYISVIAFRGINLIFMFWEISVDFVIYAAILEPKGHE